MRWSAALFVVFASLTIGPSVFAGGRVYIDSTHTRLLSEAQRAILNDQFDQADSIADCITALSPRDPAGRVSRAASMLARMTWAEDDLFGVRFERLLDTIQRLCTTELDSADRGRKAWLYLFLGHTQAYRSLYESKFGSSFTAVRFGLRTRTYYGAGLEQDSSLTDLYFGLGSYHYWKSVKAGVFRWLGLFHNDIKLGITELYRAADSSLFSRDVSRSALAWVWLDREQYDSVITLTESLRQSYPLGTSFLWPLARSRWDKKEYAAAYDVYSQLRGLLIKQPGNYFNLVECDYYLSACREKAGDKVAAAVEAVRLNEYDRYIPPRTRERQADKLRFLARLIESVETTASTE